MYFYLLNLIWLKSQHYRSVLNIYRESSIRVLQGTSTALWWSRRTASRYCSSWSVIHDPTTWSNSWRKRSFKDVIVTTTTPTTIRRRMSATNSIQWQWRDRGSAKESALTYEWIHGLVAPVYDEGI